MFTRSKFNPILKPLKKHAWEALKTYNPAVIFDNGKYHLFYRAVDKDGKSNIGYATSQDGENFSRHKSPIISPEYKYERRGIEDPRIVKINKKFLLTYNAYDGQCAHLALATSTDLKNWTKRGLILPNWYLIKAKGFVVAWDMAQQNKIATKKWHKAGGIFSEKINDKYWMLFGDRHLWLATSTDGIKWQAINKPFIRPRIGFFDSAHVEMGPAPIKTDRGWLILYHGIDQTITYRLGFLLLDLKNPKKIIYRSSQPILWPSAKYELKGKIDLTNDSKPKVIFCNGAVLIKNKLRVYYGAGDSTICTATAKLNNILSSFNL
jgi:predicted GH43/DUF377 family glycosyl hydrolase